MCGGFVTSYFFNKLSKRKIFKFELNVGMNSIYCM